MEKYEGRYYMLSHTKRCRKGCQNYKNLETVKQPTFTCYMTCIIFLCVNYSKLYICGHFGSDVS